MSGNSNDVPLLLGDGQPPAAVPPVTPSVSDIDVIRALGEFCDTILPGVPSYRGQPNKAPMPKVPNFIIMTPAGEKRFSTNERWNDDPGAAIQVQGSHEMRVQMDFYGPLSGGNALVFKILFRDDRGTEFLDPYAIAPLHCDDGRQVPLINGEFRYEDRWTVIARVQIRPIVSTPAQFADNVEVNIVEAA